MGKAWPEQVSSTERCVCAPAARSHMVSDTSQASNDAGLQLFGPSRKRRKHQPPTAEDTAAHTEPDTQPAELPIQVEDYDQMPAQDETDDQQGFRALGLSESLDRTCISLGVTAPTAVQQSCISHILKVPTGTETALSARLQPLTLQSCATGPQRDRCVAHRQWQDSHLCPAHPSAACSQPIWRVCTGAHAHQVRYWYGVESSAGRADS